MESCPKLEDLAIVGPCEILTGKLVAASTVNTSYSLKILVMISLTQQIDFNTLSYIAENLHGIETLDVEIENLAGQTNQIGESHEVVLSKFKSYLQALIARNKTVYVNLYRNGSPLLVLRSPHPLKSPNYPPSRMIYNRNSNV